MFFNNLRKLYGRSPAGKSNRRAIKITVTPETMGMIESVTDFGNGKFGSALFELGVRLLIVLVATDGSDLDWLYPELNRAIANNSNLKNNLSRLLKLLES